MRCVIPGRSVKLFAKAIHCLSRIGDELYLEALSQGLALRTVNSSRSAYACFLFNESFFISYDDGANDMSEDSQEEDILKCKIAIKSCLSVFKSMNTIEKTVDQCKIDLNIKEARLVFLLYCRHGITKTYNLTFQECETLQAVFSKDLCPNFMTAQAKILNDAVFNFPNNQEEITLVVCPETVKVKNYVDDEPDPTKVIHTEMVLAQEEFDNYQIGVDTDVTFCLKELRAILAFAEFSSQPINIHFETGGKPIVFSMDGDSTYEGDFVLATLVDHEASLPSSQASVTAAAASTSTRSISKEKQDRSSSKKIPPQQSVTVQQKTKSRATNKATASENSQRQDDAGYEQDDAMFNDDDDLDVTEIDLALQGGRTLSAAEQSQENRKEVSKNSSAKNGQMPTNQRNTDVNKSAAVLDDFFSDSFPYRGIQEKEVTCPIKTRVITDNSRVNVAFSGTKANAGAVGVLIGTKSLPPSLCLYDPGNRGKYLNFSLAYFKDWKVLKNDLFTTGRKELSVIHEASQESANTSIHGSAKPIQTPPSSVTDVSFLKNMDMPSLGNSSCVSLEVTPSKQRERKKSRKHETDPDESFMDVEADDDHEFIPGTPPHKKFKSMFFSASENRGASQDVVLAADSDED